MGKWSIGAADAAERVARCETPLLARRRGETRISDDVAGSKDVWHRGAEVRVYRDTSTIVGGESGVLKRQRLRRANASHREERHVGDDALARLELEHGTRRRAVVHGHSLDRFAEAEVRVPFPHLMYQLVHDLGVHELERPVAPIDHRDLDAEG